MLEGKVQRQAHILYWMEIAGSEESSCRKDKVVGADGVTQRSRRKNGPKIK